MEYDKAGILFIVSSFSIVRVVVKVRVRTNSDSKNFLIRRCAATSYIPAIYPLNDYKHYNCHNERHYHIFLSSNSYLTEAAVCRGNSNDIFIFR